MSRIAIVLIAAVAALAGATALSAQAPLGCPVPDAADGMPIELRLGDHVLRAQVSSDSGDERGGARVAVRLVGCEHERVVAEGDGTRPDPITGGPLVRLLNDLRLALELAPTEREGCMRASVQVSDAAPTGTGPAVADRPVAVELCLPSISVGPASRPDVP